MTESGQTTPVVRMLDCERSFPGTKALDGARLELESGEIRALLGENGAGKSTLMKVLAGVERLDGGRIEIDGSPVVFHSPRDAKRLGISMVFQETSLAPNLTIAENISLGSIPNRFGVVRWQDVQNRAKQMLQRLHIDLDVERTVRDLTTAQQQLVEIAKALAADARVLILDEPTSALTEVETAELFELVRRLAAEGTTVVYISHNIEELFELCDRVTVMRDGKTVADYEMSDVSPAELIKAMVGRELDDGFPKSDRTPGEVLLSVRDHTVQGRSAPVSFEVRAGEVLGFAGLIGSGRTALMRSIVGDIPKESGQTFLAGRPVSIRQPNDAIRAGLAYLSDDRRRSGIIGKLGIRQNISVGCLRRVSRWRVVDVRQERQAANEVIQNLDVATDGIEKRIDKLSGGNQQKVVIGRWLAANSQVLILDEPTRGIDVGAKSEVYRIVNELTESGKAVVLVSSYLPEVLGMSDRILVMRDGQIVDEFDGAGATQESIMHAATGHHGDESEHEPTASDSSTTLSTSD